jgi:hypothetical protein
LLACFHEPEDGAFGKLPLIAKVLIYLTFMNTGTEPVTASNATKKKPDPEDPARPIVLVPILLLQCFCFNAPQH